MNLRERSKKIAVVAYTEKELLENTVESLKKSLLQGDVIIAVTDGKFQNVFKYISSDCAIYAFILRNHSIKLRAIVNDVYRFSPFAPEWFNEFVKIFLKQYTHFIVDRFDNVIFDFENELDGYVRQIVMKKCFYNAGEKSSAFLLSHKICI